MFTSLIQHGWPVFNLCLLIANRWRHDRCSLIRVPSGLAVSPVHVVLVAVWALTVIYQRGLRVLIGLWCTRLAT